MWKDTTKKYHNQTLKMYSLIKIEIVVKSHLENENEWNKIKKTFY